MDGKFMADLTLDFVGEPVESLHNSVINKIKNVMLEISRRAEIYLQNLLDETGMTKEELASNYTVVEWTESSGYDVYLCVKILKNEDVDTYINAIPPNNRKTFTLDSFNSQTLTFI